MSAVCQEFVFTLCVVKGKILSAHRIFAEMAEGRRAGTTPRSYSTSLVPAHSTVRHTVFSNTSTDIYSVVLTLVTLLEKLSRCVKELVLDMSVALG